MTLRLFEVRFELLGGFLIFAESKEEAFEMALQQIEKGETTVVDKDTFAEYYKVETFEEAKEKAKKEIDEIVQEKEQKRGVVFEFYEE